MTTNVGSPVTMPANALYAFAFFVKNGYSAAQAAGMVGNFMQESGVSPSSQNPSEGAFGIANWEGNRLTNLQNFATSIGQPITSLDTQLQFVLHELSGSESGANSALKLTDTPASAATTFASQYERCGDCVMSSRVAYANNAFQSGTGQSPPAGSTFVASATSGDSSTSGNPCQINMPSLGPLGGGCLWYESWSYTLLGGLCFLAGGVLVIAGVALVAGKEVTPLAAATAGIKGMDTKFAARRQGSIDINKDISTGAIKFPDRPKNMRGRNLTTGRFAKGG